MSSARLTALALASALLALPALAGGGARTAPTVDYAALPTTAAVRPSNPNGAPHEALARLLADTTAAVPGQPFRVGVELTPKDGWHSYWKSPGDIGMPLTVTWELPEGTARTQGEFPVPLRFDQSGIVSYGYDGPVLVFDEVTLPAGTPVGMVDLRATASWLVCEAICVPGEASLSLPLAVVADAAAATPTPWAPLFDHYAKAHPTPFAAVHDVGIEHALSQSAYRPGDPFEVVFRVASTGPEPIRVPIDVATWPAFAPIVDSYQIYLYETTLTPQPDGSALIVARGDVLEVDTLPTASRIGGLFQVETSAGPVRTEYSVEVPWVAAGTPIEASTSPLWALARGDAEPAPAAPAIADAAPVASAPLMLLFAFVGGLILNVMPCVLPVVTLKLFGLVHHTEIGAAQRRKKAAAYTVGVVASFWALAAAVVIAKATLGGVGWGFQFQSPAFVVALTTIVFAFGLSLFGVFEIPALGAESASKAAGREGLGGDFFNGVFATLLATPCSAPFLGPAVGFALLQPTVMIVLFFTVIGLGLAAPFVLVGVAPALLRLLPPPGPWMDSFKKVLGFTLIGTTVWLVDVIAGLVGTDGAIGFLGFLVSVAVGAWIFGHWGDVAQSGSRQLAAAVAGTAVAALGGWQFLVFTPSDDECEPTALSAVEWEGDEIPWQAFSGAKVAAAAGKPVFVDFTADWCLTCKVNEKTVLSTATVRDAMQEHGVVPLVADWTRRDAEITEWLARFGRAGVPFYLVIPADPSAAPIPLSEVITPAGVVAALERAVESPR